MKQRFLPTLVLALALPASAQEAPLPSHLAHRVLRQVTFQDGHRTITVNRVAPPAEPAVSAPMRAAEPPPLTAEELETAERRARKDHRLLFLSATVIDREVTLLRWFTEGREYWAFSNLDFNFLRGLLEFETGDAVYSPFFGFGEDTRESTAGDVRWKIPALADFSRTRSEYHLTGDLPASPADATLAGLDALHEYFDAHRPELLAAWEKREAQRIEHERWMREHPPAPPPPLILDFWPGKDTVVFDAPARGAKP